MPGQREGPPNEQAREERISATGAGAHASGFQQGDDYDLLPYVSVPYHPTQPTHLAAIAKLFGIDTPDAAFARVLELGCASGGNIIPLAARFPDAYFVGIDLSERQVADGKARIAALGLTNIEIRQGNIETAAFLSERFDYVICHGVYSWVSAETQDAVFRITANTLSENGVAYVSYNTYPGWRLRTVVRDICLRHAGSAGAPEVRVASARWIMDQLSRLSSTTSPYGQLLREEAEFNARQPDSYILGEFLATHNAPCYFHEFAARADRHGLNFLCEADFVSSIPEALDKNAAELARQIADGNGVALEQYMDFFTGREFRQSLLVRSGSIKTRRIRPEHIDNLHFSTHWRREEKTNTDGEAVFTANGRSLAVSDSLSVALLDTMQNTFPGTYTLNEIVERISPPGRQAKPHTLVEAREALFKLIAGGQVEVSAAPLRVGRASDHKPTVWAVARSEANSGQLWLSSLRHMPVNLDKGLAAIAQLLDGKSDRRKLAELIEDGILSGTISIEGADLSKLAVSQHLSHVVPEALDRLLLFLEKNALLQDCG